MSDSIWNDPRITAYVLDELSEDDRQAFEAELAGDAELEAAVAEARNVTGQLEDLFAAEETPTLEPDRRIAIVTPVLSRRSWRTPMIALATAASLLMLIGGPMWISRQNAMTVGQMPTDAEVQTYGKEAGKDISLEGLSHSNEEVAQSEFVADQAAGRRLTEKANNSTRNAALESKKESSIRSRTESNEIQSFQSVQSLIETQISDSAQADSTEPSGLGGMSNGASRKAGAEPKPVADAEDTFTFESRRTTETSSTATSDLDSDGDIDESDVGNLKKRVITPRFAEPASKRTRAFTPQRAQLSVDVDRLASRGATNAELHKVQGNAFRDLRRENAIPLWDSELSVDHYGRGPGDSGDKFEPITDNPFKRVAEHSLSTFSVDVDTASYSKTRDFLVRAHQLPRPDAVRIEELINYFNYDYDPPTADDVHPFTTHTVVTSCPWNPEHRLARIALKGKVIEKEERPRCNLVFLLDTSGSMNQPNKLPLVVEGMQMLLKQLNKKDRVAITVYAGSAGLVLDSTAVKKKGKKKIRKALTQLNAGGSTNGGAGIALAYQTARDNFISDGVNRVILCTDGDFNVGTTGTDGLVRMVEQEAKGGIFLSVLGFGMGNHNDSMLEQVSGRGNGNYAFIDNKQEARKVLVDQTSATLVTIAKDVKLQIEFNPNQVSSYRLIGYENRVLAKEDFNDDKKDAGEIGAGHSVTALYEIVPAGTEADESRPAVDALKYQSPAKPNDAADSGELMTLKLRYKAPDGDTSTLVEFPIADETVAFGEADKDVRFAAAVAGFGMQLRRSDYKGTWTLSDVQSVAEKSKGEDKGGLRTEFIELVRKASELMGQQ